MGWTIRCIKRPLCSKETRADNIVDLIKNHTDKDGWFLCSCGEKGYIEKSFELQETGDTWKPYLRGIIQLGDLDVSYRPFVFLVSYEPEDDPVDVWFSYYKDLRSQPNGRGRLKMGYGPGGPPVLNKLKVIDLLSRMMSLGLISPDDIKKVIS